MDICIWLYESYDELCNVYIRVNIAKVPINVYEQRINLKKHSTKVFIYFYSKVLDNKHKIQSSFLIDNLEL